MLWMKTVFFLRREESFCSLHLIQFTISTAHSYPSSNSEWTCGKIMSSLVLQKWVKLLQFERLCPKLSRKCTMFCEVFWFNCCCQLVCSIVRISCVWVLHWYGYGKKNSFIYTTVVHYLGKEVKSIDYRYRFALWCVSEVFHLRRHS